MDDILDHIEQEPKKRNYAKISMVIMTIMLLVESAFLFLYSALAKQASWYVFVQTAFFIVLACIAVGAFFVAIANQIKKGKRPWWYRAVIVGTILWLLIRIVVFLDRILV